MIAVPVLALLGGCARGPVLGESASRLRIDARAVLTVGSARLGQPGTRTQVLYDKVESCPGDRARRVYRARFSLRPGPDSKVVLDRAADLSLDLITARGYRLTGPPRHHTFTVTHPAPTVSMTVRLHGGHHPTMTLDADTPCLSAN
jgi:hypothetical protein